jgi:hypothetical protein
MEIQRVSPEDARERVKAGSALFVCAYEDEGKCKANNLEDSITFGEFKQKLSTLPKNQEIIFYCK